MPKARPQFQKGRYYHFYNRGRSRLSIFHNQADFLYLLKYLKQYSVGMKITVIAYCLMPNHYHFLLRQDGDVEVAKMVQLLFNRYAKTYNGKYEHSGTIFEGSYEVKLVDTDDYLETLHVYIHANPVKDGFADTLTQWPFSNYLEWMNLRDGSLVDREFVDERYPDRDAYRVLVEEFLQK